jgi:hypothetical protein
MKTIIAALALASAASLIATSPAAAGDISGGSRLLDEGKHAQLERWLGAGEFNLNNVYTWQAGESSADFHAAADGKGAGFTLLDVSNDAGDSYLVGGYNPQSWNASEGWHETERDWQRTAFLFNFTEPAVYRQILSNYVLPSQGQRQTFNGIDFGPVFGSGPDLFVSDTMDVGLSWQLSYGNPSEEGFSIIDRSQGGQTVRIDGMEIFAITPIPEPGRQAMLLGGLGVMGAMWGRAALAQRRNATRTLRRKTA